MYNYTNTSNNCIFFCLECALLQTLEQNINLSKRAIWQSSTDSVTLLHQDSDVIESF